MKFIETEQGHAPIKAWIDGVQLEGSAEKQLRNIAGLPFIHKHVAVMPDVHMGVGATIGSVIATKGAIVPAAVGVDLGCGMMAIETTLTANDLPDNLFGLRSAIEAVVPHGRTDAGDIRTDKGSFREDDVPMTNINRLLRLNARYQAITEKHPKIEHRGYMQQLGTLGGGNHFIEICLDERDHVWVMLHSGSRGPGNKIGSYFIAKAKEEMRKWHIDKYLPDQDLSYLVEHTENFDDYIEAISWAQDYASQNRLAMMEAVLKALQASPDLPKFNTTAQAVNCHHNYASQENHFGAKVWVTRKGAVSARQDELGIIPGSMGARSFIVSGKGNRESFCSCSHGAGRTMSRTEARRTFTLEDHAAATQGIECRKDADVLDETPAAYKDIEAVMRAQSDLVKIEHTLRQIVNVKG
jgi:tRNA-splicing ligase RtcB